MPATRGAPRTPEGPSPTGPRTPDGSGMRGARTPETPFDDRYVKPRDVKRPSTPPEPYPEVSIVNILLAAGVAMLPLEETLAESNTYAEIIFWKKFL